MGAVTRIAAVAGRLRAVEPALLLLAAMVFIVQVGVAVMLPLLPLYARSLGASPTVLGLLTSVFAVTNAGGQLVTGFLAERIAMRRLLFAGIGSYAVANFLIAGAASAGALIFFRGLAGVGGGVMIVGERLYLAQLVESSRLAFANGILSAAGSAGSVTGPAIGGLLATLGDLRTPFLLVGVTSVLATVGALFLPRPRTEGQPTEEPTSEQATEEQATEEQATEEQATEEQAT
jgi:MFS transporter, DHA1 family, multidrug resistance protein